MNTYKIIYTESLCHAFYVDAASEEDAQKKFERKSENGELDFSDGEVYNSEIKIVTKVN